MDRPRGPSPFDLADDLTYRRWREWKLDTAPRRAEDLLVEVADLSAISADEDEALLDCCRRANMAVYFSPAANGRADKQLPVALGRHFGLSSPDANWLADEDAISSITPAVEGARAAFIPYTERPIRWHTDGYYSSLDSPIRAMVLHCVRPAASGGENALMDHEIAYILLRDENPDYIRALSRADAMTIPPRNDDSGEARAACVGPVFSVDAQSGDLHMRYTARERNVGWRDDSATRAARARLWVLLSADKAAAAWVLRLRMSSGMGLLCNNVLHDRAGFSDADNGARRLLYRARYHTRIRGTQGAYCCAAIGADCATPSV